MKRLQKLFNKACAGLASQGFKQSVKATGTCAYRGDRGRRCAIGHLVEDDKMARKWDREAGSGISDVYSGFPEDYKQVFGNTDCDILESLQTCHDSNNIPELMVNSLLSFAKAYGLTQPVCLRNFKCKKPRSQD